MTQPIIQQYEPKQLASRRIWIYGSMKQFLGENATTLNHEQMRGGRLSDNFNE